jgi:hypothetical protein
VLPSCREQDMKENPLCCFPGGATRKLWTPTVYRGQASKTIHIRDQEIT